MPSSARTSIGAIAEAVARGGPGAVAIGGPDVAAISPGTAATGPGVTATGPDSATELDATDDIQRWVQ